MKRRALIGGELLGEYRSHRFIRSSRALGLELSSALFYFISSHVIVNLPLCEVYQSVESSGSIF